MYLDSEAVMRPLAIAVSVVIVAALLAPGQVRADPQIRIQWGGSGGHDVPSTGIAPTPLPRSKPPGAAALDRDRDTRSRWGAPRKRDRDGKRDRDRDFPHKRFKRDQRPFLFLDDDDDDEERIVVVPVQPAEPEEPEQAEPPEPTPPPDPRGPRFVPARGASGETPYRVGEPLPAGVAFVTLDWRQYGLPEPPPGLIYARVAGDVLLFDPATRRVERRVDPATLDAAAEEPGRSVAEPE